MKELKKIENYFKKHPMFNAAVHATAGLGVGILITYPLVGEHPVKWGLTLLGLAVLGHLYPLWLKK